MSRNEFHKTLKHLAHSPQDIIFFEEGLKAYALGQQQDLFYSKYWETVRFISGCWDAAEAKGAFNHLDKEVN